MRLCLGIVVLRQMMMERRDSLDAKTRQRVWEEDANIDDLNGCSAAKPSTERL